MHYGNLALAGTILEIPYNDALSTLGDKPVLYVTAESDGTSASACRSGEKDGLGDFQIQIYKGRAHGRRSRPSPP
jgi:hypothetical protein